MAPRKSVLAINGGPKAVKTPTGDIFKWPIITKEDEAACLEVLRAGKMSGIDVTLEFEKEFAKWHGMKYCLAHNTGTNALIGAMFGCRMGYGDEIICPSMTYWASALPAMLLRSTIIYAELCRDNLTIDPKDIEHRITKRTKAIMCVHYAGYPCDMDPIMKIAKKHKLKVIEDVSHAQGGLYKGRLVGTIGHVGAMSIMSGKSLPCGEGGMLVTDDQEIYERALAFGHYERTGSDLTLPDLKKYAGLPLGGVKNRMHQLSSAVGRVQLRCYKKRMKEIQKAMDLFCDLIEEAPGLRGHRPPKKSGSTCGGWYAAHAMYYPEELGGLDIGHFARAVKAEGAAVCGPGANLLMHLHPVLNEADVYHEGKPTRIAYSNRDVRQPLGSLPVTEASPKRCMSIPWFKHYRPRIIREQAAAFVKVAAHADEVPRD
ncbi:MAG: aminotransferase class I/II-fold pyridoxal phosphate-dependent enzyme [Planctomycetota bacterium]